MNIYKMTVEELFAIGADIEVKFYNEKNSEIAYKKVKQFEGLNKIETKEHEGTNWHDATESSRERIIVTAFYDK